MPKLYEPINVLKPVADRIWIVDGPIIRMALAWLKIPFPTRMVIIQLQSGGLFIWSPVALDENLKTAIDMLGPVEHLVSPNKIHYASIPAWKKAYPQATAWASPGVRERAATQHISISFDRDLADGPDPAWATEIDQLILRGNRFMQEVIFFHRPSQTLIVADMIENFEPAKTPKTLHWLLRFGRVCDPDGQTPLDLRLLFFGSAAHADRNHAMAAQHTDDHRKLFQLVALVQPREVDRNRRLIEKRRQPGHLLSQKSVEAGGVEVPQDQGRDRELPGLHIERRR